MVRHLCFKLLTAALGSAVLASGAFAQTAGWSTGFEDTASPPANPVGYVTGSLIAQDGWDLGGAGRSPRVQTAAEIATELTDAGLTAGQTTHTGNQALLVSKMDTSVEGTGYFVRDIFPSPNTLDTATKVTVKFSVRPLTGGLGADPTGTPSGNGKTIGEREGNLFFGVSDANDGGLASSGGQRIAAMRFGTDNPAGTAPLYGSISERHIDFASASTGNVNQPWIKSGLLWVPDQWYNLRFEIDTTTKTYDFFVNDVKANVDPIVFYHTTANAVKRFFVSKGTNQAGGILDDISVMPYVAPPITPGDFDADGDVDGADYLVWQQDTSIGSLNDWQTNFGQSSSLAAVPEPGCVALALVAIVGGAAACRQRRHA